MIPIREEQQAAIEGGGNASGASKILVILPYSPNPLRPRTICLLEDLSTFAEIDLVYLDHGEHVPLSSSIRARSVLAIPNRLSSRLVRLAIGRLCGKPFAYQYYHSRTLARHIASLDLSAYGAIFVQRIPIHELRIRHPNVVYDIEDCRARQVDYCAQLPGLLGFLYRLDSIGIAKYEATICNHAARVLCNHRELEALRSIGVTAPIQVVVHATNAVGFKTRKIEDHSKRILSFHGKLSYVANKLALSEISNIILPNLDANRYEVQVAGVGAEKLRLSHPQISFRGFVEDITAYLRSVDLSIFPMQISVGVSNKLLESLAAGVPAIVTPQVAGGLPEGDGLQERGIFVREIKGFPDAIESYFQIPLSERQVISDECVAYAQTVHNTERRRKILRECVFQESQTSKQSTV